jgi:hypothetical protein
VIVQVIANKTPNFKQQKKRREDQQKKRNQQKQRQQAERRASTLQPEKSLLSVARAHCPRRYRQDLR